MKLTFEEIEKRGLLLYRYKRGSIVYGTNTPESDIDEGGVFICPQEYILGTGLDYQDEVSDKKHDTVWWELGKFMKLLMTSNPTVLESIFIPDEYVIYEHPLFTELKKNKDMFVTKESFKPFGGYAVSQIKKAQGQNKKIHWDDKNMERKTIMDFCYTFDDKQGSVKMCEWLSGRGLRQDCCGLVNIPNMPNMFGVYYDFGQHFRLDNIKSQEDLHKEEYNKLYDFIVNKFLLSSCSGTITNHINNLEEWFETNKHPIGGYCGICRNDGESNEIRFSETPKNSKPICFMSYNSNGYQTHCKKYKEYIVWKENRNKARYDNNMEGIKTGNIEYIYDAKNMMHCFRLVKMCIEVARGDGFFVDRRGRDDDFLKDIRNRKYKYSELMNMLSSLKNTMDECCEKSTIPDSINPEFMNKLTIDMRTKFYSDYVKS